MTEIISKFIDYFLIPIVKRQNSYIRDSLDFINKIESLKADKNCLLVDFDLTSMYTNLQFAEILDAVEEAYKNRVESDYTIPCPKPRSIRTLLKFVLENNFFEFNDKCYRQIIGASMGSKCSPEICDIAAYELIKQVFRKTQNKLLWKIQR